MKRIVAILLATMLAAVFCVVPAFAASSLEITKTTPANDTTGAAIDNLGVKIWFNEDMYSEKYDKAQRECFKLTDEKGEEVPIIVAINPAKDKRNEVLVLEDSTTDYEVLQETKYTLTISEDLVSAAGNTLSEASLAENGTVTFTTQNQKKAMTGNMVLMFAMMGGMIFFTMRDTRKQAEEETTRKKTEQKVNPYKEAKKTGKTVEDIVAKDEKDKAKRAEKEAAKEAKKEKQREADRRLAEKEAAKLMKDRREKVEVEDPFRKRVSRPRPISEAGSTYKTGRKALAEAAEAKRKAEEEARKARGTTNPKKKGKGKKKK